MKKMAILLGLVLMLSQSAFAQNHSSQMPNMRRSVATVIFAGLGGAVLGLSTLSFYGEPQGHVGNIWLGLGVGLLAGTAYVSMNSDGYSQIEVPTNPNQRQRHRDAPQLFVYNFDF